ncbi:MAG: hypothetical protein ABJC98_06810 [Bacteroidota bacterium]
MSKKYFERNSKEDKYAFLFLPEFETCEVIMKIIGSGKFLRSEQIDSIKHAYNKIIHLEHYNGSAWFDFKIRLGGLLAVYGYNTQWNSETDELIISFSAPQSPA